MIISEQQGYIAGFECRADYGFQFQVNSLGSRYGSQSYYVPFNENRPKAINFDDFQGKRVKITVEMED